MVRRARRDDRIDGQRPRSSAQRPGRTVHARDAGARGRRRDARLPHRLVGEPRAGGVEPVGRGAALRGESGARADLLEHHRGRHRPRRERCGHGAVGHGAALVSGQARRLSPASGTHVRIRRRARAGGDPDGADRGQRRQAARDRRHARAAMERRAGVSAVAGARPVLQHARRPHRAGRAERGVRGGAPIVAPVRRRDDDDLRAVSPVRHRGRRGAARAAALSRRPMPASSSPRASGRIVSGRCAC